MADSNIPHDRGGIDSEHHVHNSLEVLDPEGKQWAFLAPMPTPRMDCSAVFAGDSIFVTGGQDGEVLSSTCFYNPESNEWSSGPSMLTPRYGHGLVVTAL
ncbi:kelch motif domain-containing protein, putative [Eimeria praecox]|uniref:Kelch motif domain-containing protein, putative n=1 Tax=Eimeria praecox TaxID=51316 RepID=U6GAT2_9EIME|nr:kelch motif domain-containing protein, putative [Eimeria praecox]